MRSARSPNQRRVPIPKPNRSRNRKIWFWKLLLISIFISLIIIFVSLSRRNSGSTILAKFSENAERLSAAAAAAPENDPLMAMADMNQSQNDEDLLNEITLVQNNFDRLEQSDPKLIRYVRARYLTPPMAKGKPYNFKSKKSPREKSAIEKWVRDFYKEKRKGVFLEAGANDGETSNTLALEMELGWSGLLIECNPKVTPELKNVGRKAWLATVCLSTNGYPQVVNMSFPETWKTRDHQVSLNWAFWDGIEAVPLYPILAGVGLKAIDYFRFDVVGSEWAALKDFPFNKILIKILIVDVFFYDSESRKGLKTFLEKKGLILIREIEADQIYVHESLQSVLRNGRVAVEGLAHDNLEA